MMKGEEVAVVVIVGSFYMGETEEYEWPEGGMYPLALYYLFQLFRAYYIIIISTPSQSGNWHRIAALSLDMGVDTGY